MSGQVIVWNVRRPAPEGFTPVYVGRRTSYRPEYGEDYSVLGNPYTLRGYARQEAIEAYRAYLMEAVKSGLRLPVAQGFVQLANRVHAGENLALGCFCHPQPCHADEIKAVLDAAGGTP